MQTIAKTVQMEVKPPRQLCQRGVRIKRNMTIARRAIPPIVQTIVDRLLRTKQCAEKQSAILAKKAIDVFDQRHRIVHMLEYFEAGHHIELAIRALA